MEEALSEHRELDLRIAGRIRTARAERGWSLDELARRSGVSRATLSRLENAAVSPTASVLGRICAAFGLPLSRLMYLVEGDFAPLVRRHEQPVWSDGSAGFTRRAVSPPAQTLAGEAIEAELAPGTRIAYPHPPRAGLEHHLILIEGRLSLSIGPRTYDLQPGDCLRYQLHDESIFVTPPDSGARYFLFMV